MKIIVYMTYFEIIVLFTINNIEYILYINYMYNTMGCIVSIPLIRFNATIQIKPFGIHTHSLIKPLNSRSSTWAPYFQSTMLTKRSHNPHETTTNI